MLLHPDATDASKSQHAASCLLPAQQELEAPVDGCIALLCGGVWPTCTGVLEMLVYAALCCNLMCCVLCSHCHLDSYWGPGSYLDRRRILPLLSAWRMDRACCKRYLPKPCAGRLLWEDRPHVCGARSEEGALGSLSMEASSILRSWQSPPVLPVWGAG